MSNEHLFALSADLLIVTRHVNVLWRKKNEKRYASNWSLTSIQCAECKRYLMASARQHSNFTQYIRLMKMIWLLSNTNFAFISSKSLHSIKELLMQNGKPWTEWRRRYHENSMTGDTIRWHAICLLNKHFFYVHFATQFNLRIFFFAKRKKWIVKSTKKNKQVRNAYVSCGDWLAHR